VAISLKWSEDSKIPMAFFTEMKKIILNFLRKHKRPGEDK
jgi:hypothetical protein